MNTQKKRGSFTSERSNRKRTSLNNQKNNPQRNNRRNSKKKAVSTLKPSQLINKNVTVEKVKQFIADRPYADLPININLKDNIRKKGFDFPTEIQQETLAALQDGRDLIGIANTGTGKTAAFLIPLIDRLIGAPKSVRSLVVVPTRELATQVEQEFLELSKGLNLNATVLIGGTSVQRDVNNLRKYKDIVIGTPGRILDLYNRGNLKLGQFTNLILDEFDRMLDMGFKNDIQKMVDAMVNRKQTVLFSATIDPAQKQLVNSMVHNAVKVQINSGLSASDRVYQDIIPVPVGSDKFKMLSDLVIDDEFKRVLIFTETKRQADKVSKQLNAQGMSADQIHGNKSQNYRNKALAKFKKGNVRFLVATDVAARGIDVSDVSHVINYQMPLTMDSYVHRIGRTGRAGKLGKAFTFID